MDAAAAGGPLPHGSGSLTRPPSSLSQEHTHDGRHRRDHARADGTGPKSPVLGPGRLRRRPAVGPDTDLWESGPDSLLSVSPMVALEDEFDPEFPDEMLTHQTSSSVRRISDGIATLVAK
ncbi:hypothetical protein I3215_07230 [Streptomyces sp. RB110-1]|uniref:phosphopantetheine-binding protein n=1 Tax=unclassified Streptomyces TaxID=2593676 RepID=UPI0018FF1A74|nr:MULTISPECIES: phosphopantetheine-binding protein [unclassified Streptomyces]MBK0372607.1 hypothetical protein [Streptomyces sp. RB110-1]MBK0372687.1 hypothetical protein [Streptomyces sp. RB110-1]MBK0384677.1 hypothetical protein [Streptomyces sp. RB110-2]MBK0390945.1 hypothetical protein [Streptomyces sp. RB110-2]